MRVPNAYSRLWVDSFLRTRDAEETLCEAAFVMRQCPLPAHRRVLDVACGLGRHARALAAQGYRVVGIDRDPALVAEAQEATGPAALFAVHEMERLDEIPGVFDAVLSLWQSFGYFDDAGNERLLREFAAKLRPGGRLVLDVNHRGFFARRRGRRAFVVEGRNVEERRELSGDRETVTLDYGPDVPVDVFEWRLYTPEELIPLGAAAGLTCLLACSRFDEMRPATSAEPRMQLVFEKRAPSAS